MSPLQYNGFDLFLDFCFKKALVTDQNLDCYEKFEMYRKFGRKGEVGRVRWRK